MVCFVPSVCLSIRKSCQRLGTRNCSKLGRSLYVVLCYGCHVVKQQTTLSREGSLSFLFGSQILKEGIHCFRSKFFPSRLGPVSLEVTNLKSQEYLKRVPLHAAFHNHSFSHCPDMTELRLKRT